MPLRLKYLVDNAQPPRVADLLVSPGHDAIHVRAYGMQASTDVAILERAREEERIILSADSDFGVLLASQGGFTPFVCSFSQPNLLQAEEYVDLLLPVPSGA